MKTQILLLHGALGSTAELEPLKALLDENFEVRALNFPGHGGSDFLAEPLALENTREFLNAFIAREFNPGQPLIICGHSMGGYMALYLAQQGNTAISAVITIGTKLHWSIDISAREIAMLDPLKMMAKVPHFAESLKALHGEATWQRLVFEVGHFLRDLGERNPLDISMVRDLRTPCRIMLGDRDRMVGLQETLDFYQALPKASLSILPNTPHPFVNADCQRLCFEIREIANTLNTASPSEAGN